MADNTIRLGDRDAWLLSLANGEKRAYRDVKLFLSAVGRMQNIRHRKAQFDPGKTHKYFQLFAKEMGWTGPLYEIEPDTGRCPAVTLYLRDDAPREGGFWMILPWADDEGESWRLDESPVKEKLLEAAWVVCRAWFPGLDWSPP